MDQIKKYHKQYCDNTCASRSRIVRKTKPCLICGDDVTRKPSEFKGNVFCGRDCYYVFNRKKPINKETYECDFCGSGFQQWASQIKDNKHSYCSDECRYKHFGELNKGKNHFRWNPNLTDEDRASNRKSPEYLKWRLDVYKRDSYTCQCCRDNKGGNIVAHHILNFSEHIALQTDINNGITLCETCHKDFHGLYGYTGNNKTQLEEFTQRQANQLPIMSVTT